MILYRGLSAGTSTAAITAQIQAAATAAGVDPNLAVMVAQHESGLNPNAQNPNSSAAGLFQLTTAAQQTFGVTNPFDPTQNINAGVAYLAQMQQKYGGNETLALLAYAWGPGNVDNWLASGANASSVLPESANFVSAMGYSVSNLGTSGGAGSTWDTTAPTPSVDFSTVFPDLSSIDPSSFLPLLLVGLGGLAIFALARR